MRSHWWWLVGFLFLASIVLHQNVLFLMSLLLALVGGTSFLWARYCLVGVSYQRRFGSLYLFQGEETTLDIEITNAKPLPLPWLRAEDEFPDQVTVIHGALTPSSRAGRREMVTMLSLRWYERVTRHYRLRAVKRGAWSFGPLSISAEDIFGFTLKSTTMPGVQTLVVYPKIVPVTALGLPAQHPFGDFRTPLRVIEDPIRLMGTRDYAPGDNFRHIHWKATARQGTLQTKVFEPSASRPLAIFLNVNTFEHVWEGIDSQVQEMAITAAASIARFGWDQGSPIGLYANSIVFPGGDRIRIPPGTHSDQLIWVLEALAKVVEYGRWPVEAVMQVEAGALPYGTTAVVITAVVNDALLRTLMDLRRREHGVVLVTLGKAQVEAPPPGVVYYHIDRQSGGQEDGRELEALQLAW